MADHAVDTGLVISIVSLIISIIAFIVAAAQALQQFASSADGYRRCKEGIMGAWGKLTRRPFTVDEFRFKVVFHSPVIFVSNPANRYGPLSGDVYNIDGSDHSYRVTHCRHEKEIEAQRKEMTEYSGLSRIMRVHRADDELASWVALLENLQKAERSGRQWELDHTKNSLCRKQYGHVSSQLVVQLQSRRRDWGSMPDAVQKPFATSNISHLVEFAVMLGMVWRQFEQDSWNLRAEGNGYMLLSETVWGLGISLAFSVTGKSTFQANRPIPCPALKELVFGSVPTILPDLVLNFEPANEDHDDMQITRRTLRRFGCGRGSIKRYFTRHNHIRSVNFEIIAMTAPVFRIRGSLFKRLPNPTPDTWITSISASGLTLNFIEELTALTATSGSTPQVEWIQNSWKNQLLQVWHVSLIDTDLDMRETVHDIIDQIDSYLKKQDEGQFTHDVVSKHLIAVLEELNTEGAFLASSECDTEEELMEEYFKKIREKVLSDRVSTDPNSAIQASRKTLATAAVAPTAPRRSISSMGRSKPDLQDVWLTLMWRMCLWLLLHDFDETDVMILPPTLKGSRLPVYIL